MKNFKIISAAIAVSSILITSVFGSVLGSSFINGYSMPIGEEAYFCHNTYLSDQSGVGLQSENYIVYTPNPSITPVISYGETVYGNLINTLNDGNRLCDMGKDIIGGINADYFSLQTGVPMSNLLIDGEIITKDGTASYGFGIDENGKGFTGENYITATLIRSDGRAMNIDCINKYRQPYSMYLLNSKFSDQTHNNTLGFDIIIEGDTDEFHLGEAIKGKVTYALCYEGSIKIPENSVILTVDVNAPMFDLIADIAVGDEVEIVFDAPTEPRWNTARFGMGSTGEYILSKGEVTPNLKAGANPRSAIGITENGDIVLYTIDGRQSGHSYGVQLSTLAKRMKELGCVEAINLDGGGSTTIVGRLIGNDGLAILNKPSDGSARKVSTSIFLQNNLKATGEIGHIQIYPASASYVMNGASITLEATGIDTGYHPMDISGKVDFSVESDKKSTINKNGIFTAKDNGSVFVTASYGGAAASHEVVCVKTPTELSIKNEKGQTITALKIKRNETADLSALAKYGYHDVVGGDDCFTWDVSENIGKIDENGKFTASNSIGASGTITVSAGDAICEIKAYVLPDGTEDEELLYSKLEAEISDEGLIGAISNEYNIDVQKENLKITADGNEISAEFNNHDFVARLPENTHKIRITATNDLGYTTVLSLTLDNQNPIKNPFADTKDSWARDILSYMFSQGLVNGESMDKGLCYNPQKEMTRSEFAVLICNYLKINPSDYENVSLPYTDLKEIPSWALNQFKALYSLGIIKGRDDGKGGSYADPKTGISRAEAFTVITRLLPSGLKKTEVIGKDKNDIPSWAMEGFEILMADKTVSGYEDGTLKPLKKLTKAEAAKLLYSLY